MSKSGVVRALLKRHGNAVEIFAGEEAVGRKAYALIQPLRYKNKRYIEGDFIQGGIVDSRHFLYIGTADVRIDLMGGPVILQRGAEKYTVRRSEAVFLDRECIYVWSILQPYVPGV